MAYIGTSPSNGVRRIHTYTATAGQTTFTGSSTEGVTLTYADTNYIDVFQNGVLLGSADYTSTSGTSVVLAQGASVSDLVVIVVYDVFSVADTVSKTAGGSFDSGVTVTGDLGVGISPATSYGRVTQIHDTGTSGANLRLTDSTSGSGTGNGFEIIQIGVNNYMINRETGFISLYTNNAEALKIDSAGHVTMPKQSAFCVTGLDGNQDNVTVGGVVTVKYYDERFDQNLDYNNSNYTFTAPVTGKYYLHAQVYVNSVDSAASYYSLRVDTSNHDYVSIYNITHTDTNFLTFQIDVIADMDASDTATVGFLQPDGTAQTDIADNTEYTFFCGHLVC